MASKRAYTIVSQYNATFCKYNLDGDDIMAFNQNLYGENYIFTVANTLWQRDMSKGQNIMKPLQPPRDCER